MKNKEKKTEEFLEQSIQNSAIEDFGVRFEKIKKEKQFFLETTKKSFYRRMVFIATTCCSVAICLGIILPLMLRSINKVYFEEQIIKTPMEEYEFFTSLSEAKINIVDLSDYTKSEYYLLYVEDNILVGGQLTILNEAGNDTEYISISCYNSLVVIDENFYSDYNLSYDTEFVNVRYILTDYIEVQGYTAYEYDALIWHDDLVYKINYTATKDGLIDFINITFI